MRLEQQGLVGWREWIMFPTFDACLVKAKVDTGARTSAIHALDPELKQIDGRDHVAFHIQPDQHDESRRVSCVAPLVERRAITDSGGHTQERFVVRVTIELGAHAWPIELSLSDRDTMGFRMLLGRTAVRHRFLVAPGRSYLAGRSMAAVVDEATAKRAARSGVS
ncbi:MAG: RimK/LysX family protein [Pseudomonadota bacterium]